MADPGITVSITPAANMEAAAVPVMVTVNPPPGGQPGQPGWPNACRTPADICCVVDVSGSMGSEAMLKTESGQMSGHGLSVLDIVKHAMKTIIKIMNEHDRLALVAYSNDAKVIFGLTVMNDEGKVTTEEQLRELQPAGMTNLWDGLKNGFEILKAGQQQSGRLAHMMLFTDGLPNINPPRGILPMLKRLKDKEGGKLPCTINTYGFGYELDSELLSDIAVNGAGAYAFIPDAGFVGTVFVNAMSNLMVNMSKDVVLSLEATNGAKLSTDSSVLGGHSCEEVRAGEVRNVKLGSVQFGQPKNVVVNMTIPPDAVGLGYLRATVTYVTRESPAPKTASATAQGNGPASSETEENVRRLSFVDGVRQILATLKQTSAEKSFNKALPLADAQAIMLRIANEINNSPAKQQQKMLSLMEDLNGQVTEAISRDDYYTRWGCHFLPSLMFAHLSQQCNNFKDAGVQEYGGDLFHELRDHADEVFLTLPAPVASARPAPAAAAPQAYVPAQQSVSTPTVSMNVFHDRYAG